MAVEEEWRWGKRTVLVSGSQRCAAEPAAPAAVPLPSLRCRGLQVLLLRLQ